MVTRGCSMEIVARRELGELNPWAAGRPAVFHCT
jgi:hypothetical protein